MALGNDALADVFAPLCVQKEIVVKEGEGGIAQSSDLTEFLKDIVRRAGTVLTSAEGWAVAVGACRGTATRG